MLIWDCYCSCLIRGWHTNTHINTQTSHRRAVRLILSLTENLMDWSNTLQCTQSRCVLSFVLQPSHDHSVFHPYGTLNSSLIFVLQKLIISITCCWLETWNDWLTPQIERSKRWLAPGVRKSSRYYLHVYLQYYICLTLPSLLVLNHSFTQLSVASGVVIAEYFQQHS